MCWLLCWLLFVNLYTEMVPSRCYLLFSYLYIYRALYLQTTCTPVNQFKTINTIQSPRTHVGIIYMSISTQSKWITIYRIRNHQQFWFLENYWLFSSLFEFFFMCVSTYICVCASASCLKIGYCILVLTLSECF